MSTFQNNKLTFAHVEQMLNSIQPEPSSDFHQRMAKMPWKKHMHPETRPRMRRYGFSASIFALLLIVAFFLVTPMGSAIAKDIVQFFIRSDSDVKTLPTQYVFVPLSTPTTEPPFGLALVPSVMENPRPTAIPVTPNGLSLDEAEALAGFELFEPSKLPRDYNLTQVDYDTEKQVVSMWYRSPQAGTGEFFLLSQGRNLDPNKIGESAKVEIIQIGDINAELVRGGWFVQDGSSEEIWEDQAEEYSIRWKEQDISIQIFIMLNESSSPAYITLEEMTALAQSVVQCSSSNSDICYGSHAIASHFPMPPVDDYEMTSYRSVAEIEPFAEYDILEPELLPEGIPFSHVRFNSKEQLAWIFCGDYAEDLMRVDGPNLFISQHMLKEGVATETFFYPEEAIQQVEVNGNPAKLFTGSLEWPEDTSTLPTSPLPWLPDTGEMKLVWSYNNVEFNISFSPGFMGGERLSQENLLRIADSLK